MKIDFLDAVKKVITGFSFAIGVAACKWVCTLIPLAGFNLNF